MPGVAVTCRVPPAPREVTEEPAGGEACALAALRGAQLVRLAPRAQAAHAHTRGLSVPRTASHSGCTRAHAHTRTRAHPRLRRTEHHVALRLHTRTHAVCQYRAPRSP
eukprot:293036-Rhodomonas_salina.3